MKPNRILAKKSFESQRTARLKFQIFLDTLEAIQPTFFLFIQSSFDSHFSFFLEFLFLSIALCELGEPFVNQYEPYVVVTAYGFAFMQMFVIRLYFVIFFVSASV